MEPRFSPGDRVVLKALQNKIGIVDGESREMKGKSFYPVSVDPSKQSPYYPEDSLEQYTPPRSVAELLKAKEFSEVQEFVRFLIYRKLERPLSDNLYTFYASRTEFQVHQFKPVLKFLNAPTQRLLLADEVGLGKTIEAGIIVTELSARLGDLSRILVVCPSMLTQKWETEMRKRFSLQFEVLTRKDFEEFLDQYVEYGEAQRMKAIVSLQTLRGTRVLQRLREIEPHFDIVVVDEAHYMRNPETRSSQLGEILSDLSDALLFLSATPLQLGTPDLFNLLRLLVPEEFSDFPLFERLIQPNEYLNETLRRLHDPGAAAQLLRKVESTSQQERFVNNPFYREALELLNSTGNLTHGQAVRLQKLLIELNCLSYVFTRTKKRDVATQFPVREARTILVKFTPEEMDFYRAVTQFVAECFARTHAYPQGLSFAVIMPQRQVASCIQAMKDSLDDVIHNGVIRGPSGDNGDVIDLSADLEADWQLGNREMSCINTLRRSASRLENVDTKFDEFLEALRTLEKEDPDSKVMVFAFFRKTLEYLRTRLSATEYRRRVTLIHGNVPMRERQRIIARFRRSKDTKILLSSEVGGEGLDFEFCNAIFNYDLPWNPARVEQRIGRLDRYGQQHEKILIYNFSMVGTIDDEILKRLYRRINIFERYIGDLDAILGDQITKLTRQMFNTELSHEQKIEKIEKVAENLERKQKELEEFENECQKFIGQDEYFNQEITRVLETKRFVTANEVLFFLESFLGAHFPKTILSPPRSGQEKVFVLKCDDAFRRFVREFSQKDENLVPLERKLSFNGGALVTFNDQAACRDEALEFITIHHPIIKAIKRFYETSGDGMHSTAQFRLQGKKENAGRYLFLVYLLEKTALKKDLVLLPILVNLRTGNVHIQENLCDWFLGQVVSAESVTEENLASYDEKELKRFFRESEEYLGMVREEEEQRLRRNNDTLVNNQIESVRQAASLKIGKTRETIHKLTAAGKTQEDSIVRLYRGRIRNLEASREQKIAKFEQKRSVSVSFHLLAGGVVSIEPE